MIDTPDPVRIELGLPNAVKFQEGEDGIHIVSAFGDTWCTDLYDDEARDFVEAPELFGAATPASVDSLCRMCVMAAREELEA